MTGLSDTQAILLSSAAARDDGSLYPLPTTLKPGGGTAKALAALMAKGLAEERETSSNDMTRRADGDVRYGLFITPAGLTTIGADQPEEGAGDTSSADRRKADVPLPAKTPSKTSIVLDLLRRPEGATLPGLIEATGWLPHTTRAALTGLRKKGHVIERTKRDGVTCYRIVAAG